MNDAKNTSIGQKFASRAVLGLAIAGLACSAAGDEPSVDDIVKGKAPPVDYSQAETCLRSELIERTEPLNDRYIVFHLRGNETWLAQMRGRCPGLTPNAKLVFEKDSPRICEWDSVRVAYDNGLGNGLTFGPRCNLPKFEPVSEEQVTMLKDAIVAARKSPPKSDQ